MSASFCCSTNPNHTRKNKRREEQEQESKRFPDHQGADALFSFWISLAIFNQAGVTALVPQLRFMRCSKSCHHWITWKRGKRPGLVAPWRECTNRRPPNSACSDAVQSCWKLATSPPSQSTKPGDGHRKQMVDVETVQGPRFFKCIKKCRQRNKFWNLNPPVTVKTWWNRVAQRLGPRLTNMSVIEYLCN